MRKGLIIAIVIVILVVAIALRMGASRRHSQTEESTVIVPVEVVAVKKGLVRSTCEVLGTIAADKTAQVFPETMGRITRIMLKEGAYVSKDTELMAIRNETVGFEYEEGFIKSPISGTIGKILVDVGAMVAPQTPVAVVVDYERVKVEFNVAEMQSGCIRNGQKVEIVIDGISEEFGGSISEISPVIDPMTRTIAVKAAVSNPRKVLKPGMTARVRMNLGERENVLVIPRDALLDSYLFVVKDSTAERRNVVVGLIGDENLEIAQGIQEGDMVVIVGQQRLAGGEKVKPVVRSE